MKLLISPSSAVGIFCGTAATRCGASSPQNSGFDKKPTTQKWQIALLEDSCHVTVAIFREKFRRSAASELVGYFIVHPTKNGNPIPPATTREVSK